MKRKIRKIGIMALSLCMLMPIAPSFAETVEYMPQNRVIVEGEAENGTVTMMLVDKSLSADDEIMPENIGYIAQAECGGEYRFDFEFYKDISKYSVLIRENGEIISDSVKRAETVIDAMSFDIDLKSAENLSSVRAIIENKFNLEFDDAKLILASYDKDGRLIGVKQAKALSGEELTLSGASAKAFLWDASRQLPLCPKKESGNIQKTVYVSPTGDDSQNGSEKSPLKSLRKAVEVMTEYANSEENSGGKLQIVLRGGEYRLDEGINIKNFKFADTELEICAYDGEVPKLNASKTIPVSAFKKVSDEDVLKRVYDSVRDKLYVADLSALGITDFGALEEKTAGVFTTRGFDLYFNEKPLTLGRYPNEGLENIGLIMSDDKANNKLAFKAPDNAAARWATASDMRIYGLLYYGWFETYQRVSVNEEKNLIELSKYPTYGASQARGKYYVYNLLEEIDVPGEYYLDRENAKLYLYPPEDLAGAQIEYVNGLKSAVIKIENSENVTLRNLTLCQNAGDAISVSGASQSVHSKNILIDNCRVYNCTSGGINLNWFTVSDAAVKNCEVFNVGARGIHVQSPNTDTRLAPANILIENNYLHNTSMYNKLYNPSIYAVGAGITVRNNTVHDAPHSAIQYGGHDILIENNNIYDVCKESDDAGAIYTGNNWIASAVVRNNFIHDCKGLGSQIVGIYVDNLGSGEEIYNNVIANIDQGTLFNGGIRNTYRNNLIINCKNAYDYSAWGAQSGADSAVANETELVRKKMQLADYIEKYPYITTLLDRNPRYTVDVTIKDNIITKGSIATANEQYVKNGESNQISDPTEVDLGICRILSDATLDISNPEALDGKFEIYTIMQNVGARRTK